MKSPPKLVLSPLLFQQERKRMEVSDSEKAQQRVVAARVHNLFLSFTPPPPPSVPLLLFPRFTGLFCSFPSPLLRLSISMMLIKVGR